MSDFTALLDELPVPEHAPDFWDRLEGALDGVDPGDDAGTPALIDPLTGDDLRGDAEPTVDLETRRRTRRWLAIAIAAAVVVLIAAIAGINALTEDSAPGPVVTDPTPPPTPSRPPTPDRPAIADAPLTWSPTEANLETENGVIVGANETGYFAFAPPPLGGLLRSDDGLQWEPIDARSIMVDGTSPSWSADATTTEFPTAGVEISSHGVLVAEISHRDATDPRLRIWRSADGEQWTLDEVELVEASLRDHVGVAPGRDFLEAPPVLIASSPDTVVAGPNTTSR